MPLIRRIPKRGFNNPFKTIHIPINLGKLNVFDDGAKVDESALRAIGLANGRADGIKILAHGEITKKLNVVADAFSATAKAKIEKAGGTCQLVAATKPVKSGKKSS